MPNFNLQKYLEKTENEFRERFGEFVVEKNNRIVASEEGVLQFLRSAIENAVKEVVKETRKAILADLFILRDATDKKPPEVFKEDFIDFVGNIDDLST